ncbi:MAG TPA: ROK family transcriptional regulator [Ktedonobacteraceae bacterium]|jgi:predicted NBD/HSP70 family sugar kinase|nr:ROK family transcriptional regulator [Ktedonobacteraceae bacterium]
MGPNPTARDLRRINRRTVLQAMLTDRTISRLELSQRSGLSTGTVTNVVAELLAEGIILEAGFEASEGGRRRAILTLNSQYGYFLGGEIGETDIAVELFDITLRKLKAVRYPLASAQNNPAHVVNYVIEGATSLLQEAQVGQDKILGLGLGLPGIVERLGDELVSAPAWGWEPVPLKTMLREHFSFPLHIDNGAKTMALAEMRLNPGAPMETMAVLHLGTGVSAGVIYEGKLYRGASNSAGEWGHTIMNLDGQPCRCGRQGCLEAYVGAPGIMRHLRELDAHHPTLGSDGEIGTIAALLTSMRSGDPVAVQVVQDTVQYLGAGVANVINLFNPQRVILGGWLGLQLGEFVLPAIRHATQRYALKQPFEVAKMSVSVLGRDGVSIGAAIIALEDFVESVGGRTSYPTLAAGFL